MPPSVDEGCTGEECGCTGEECEVVVVEEDDHVEEAWAPWGRARGFGSKGPKSFKSVEEEDEDELEIEWKQGRILTRDSRVALRELRRDEDYELSRREQRALQQDKAARQRRRARKARTAERKERQAMRGEEHEHEY